MAHDAPAGTVEYYRMRLTVMHDRLARQIADEREHAEDSLKGSTGDGILHTHNADMDTEGLDAAVGTARGLHKELDEVDGALSELTDRPGDAKVEEREKARFDMVLSTQDFAEEMDRKFGAKK
ncbi:hypothetical protein [Alienimonas chondri]|nr:hypothetical protein [Alienimonas chondri]